MLKTKITPELLIKYLQADMNILISGHHGLGKTQCMTKACEEVFGPMNEKYMYFSCSTMDPHLDFKGIPTRVTAEDGTEYMDLIVSKLLKKGQVEHIIFDELNRAPDTVINGVMELIQFKSINGKKFPHMRSVSAMVNPTEEDDNSNNHIYAVNQLDPAHKDRFQIHLEAEYVASVEYFLKTYGYAGEAAAIHWNKLPETQKHMFSPRRLEAAVQLFQMDIPFAHCTVPAAVNPAAFLESMRGASKKQQLQDLLKANVAKDIYEFINNDTNFFHIESVILNDPRSSMHHLSEERIAMMIKKHSAIYSYAEKNPDSHKNISRVLSLISKQYMENEIKLLSDPTLSEFTWNKLHQQYMGTPNSFEPSEDQLLRGLSTTEAFEEYRRERKAALNIPQKSNANKDSSN